MKRNSYLLVLASLVIGVLITAGLSRSNSLGKMDNCTYEAPGGAKTAFTNQAQAPLVKLCGANQLGYPYKYLHSQIVFTEGTTDTGKGVFMTAKPWIEFKAATADWLIWSVVSAIGLGLSISLIEKSGMTTGFMSKKRRR